MSQKYMLNAIITHAHHGLILRQIHSSCGHNCNSMLKPRRLQYGEFLNDLRNPWPHALPKHIFPHPPLPDVNPPPKRPAPFPNDPIQPEPKGYGEYYHKNEPWRRPFPR